jgi:glycosyltransferase 2 family protein
MTRSRVLIALGGLVLSGIFLWLAVRDADPDAVRDALGEADVGLVLLASLAFMCGYLLQATRWRKIAATPQVGLRRFYEMVLGGLACNNVLPIRIGEVVRAGWLSREAPMPGGRALGTVALDRACDVVTLALFLVVGLLAVPTPAWLRNMIIGAAVLVALILAVLVFARLYTRSRGRDRRERGRIRRIVRDTIDFLGEPIGRHRAAMWLALSIAAWSIGAVSVYLVARSVSVELAPLDAVFVASALALGVAIPSSPGYIGTYQLIAVEALGLLDVDESQALAFAILMQASWYVPTTLIGGAIIGWRALRMTDRPGSPPSGRAEATDLGGRYPP